MFKFLIEKIVLIGFATSFCLNLILSTITAESVPMLIAMAAGTAGAVIWWLVAPRTKLLQAEVESHAIQIKSWKTQQEVWEARIAAAELGRDTLERRLGEQLSICREALAEARMRIAELEAHDNGTNSGGRSTSRYPEA